MLRFSHTELSGNYMMLNYPRAFYQVMRDSRLNPGELDRVIDRRLRQVLVSAFLHVPYYREIMRSVNYDPTRDYQGPGDLARLPVTRKQTLKEKGITAFVREGSDLSRASVDSTSGSSGIPIKVYKSTHERSLQIAKWMRVLYKNGYSVRHRTMALVAPDRNKAGTVVQRLGFFRLLTVDYLNSLPEEMVDILLDYQPQVLYGNRSHLDLVALELMHRGVRADGVRLVVGGGEVIPESSRRLYRQIFGVELIESYGTVEMGVMAYETQAHDGLHLCTDLTYFEFLDRKGRPAAPGEPSRIVVTDLASKLMPFIRYDQGDLAIIEVRESSGGKPEQILTQVIGRQSDLAVLPDGTVCSPYTFSVILKKFEAISQFRVVQKAPDRFRILIVAEPSYVRAIHTELSGHLARQFPCMVSFEIVRVERLDPDPTGKLRMLISEVDDTIEGDRAA